MFFRKQFMGAVFLLHHRFPDGCESEVEILKVTRREDVQVCCLQEDYFTIRFWLLIDDINKKLKRLHLNE